MHRVVRTSLRRIVWQATQMRLLSLQICDHINGAIQLERLARDQSRVLSGIDSSCV